MICVLQVISVSKRKNKAHLGIESDTGKRVAFHTKWSGKVNMKIWYLSKNLNKPKEENMKII